MEPSEKQRLQLMWHYENQAYEAGAQRVFGVDEAGRGPLAGPVVAAACFLPKGLFIAGINDSKKLSPKKREELFAVLKAHPDVQFSYSIVEAQTIDEINILEATKVAMHQSLEKLSLSKTDSVLIDGLDLDLPAKTLMLYKGDSLSCSIAAASIVAKVIRDRIMLDLHARWPQYAFDKHKGYGTQLHMEKLSELGPCPEHRMSFAPVRKAQMKLAMR